MSSPVIRTLKKKPVEPCTEDTVNINHVRLIAPKRTQRWIGTPVAERLRRRAEQITR